MTFGEFQKTYNALFAKPKRDRMVKVVEEGTGKTLYNDELGATEFKERNGEYSREITCWSFLGANYIIVCVK